MKKISIIVASIVICVIVCALIAVCISNDPVYNQITSDFLKYFNLIVTPLGIILGIIVGYPLIKKKLVENYVSRQFEIMHEANRVVRKECLKLINRYAEKQTSNKLQKDYILSIVPDIQHLSELTFDANPDAHRYTLLINKVLHKFAEKYPIDGIVGYYNNTLYDFVHIHVKQIYDYSKSLGTSFSSTVKEKRRLVNRLDKFVCDNRYTEIESIDYSVDYRASSHLLVLFFSNSFSTILHQNAMLFLECYKAVPSPCPIARLLYNREVYLPPCIKSEDPLPFGIERELFLIGFNSRRADKADGEYLYYVCHYANISMTGFVIGTIFNKESLAKYTDSYLEKTKFDFSKISDFNVLAHETISFTVDTAYLKKLFKENKRKLIHKLKL
ncbi:MAG: hypothetical protein LBD23_02985 [Oscillospiraceae bacterium]|jgi:hypothetical protein|nr:hypothetical protein [Oscillospiraceae bacterium]